MEPRDPFCTITHAAAAFWALVATVLVLRASRAPAASRLAFGLFGGSMVLLYSASAAFHAVPFTLASNPVEFRFFQRFDQAAIFVLIAGTNTPIIVCLLRGEWRRYCLAGMWALALLTAAGIWLLPKPPHEAIIGLTLVMGWLGILPIVRYYRAVGWRAMNRMWVGILIYTAAAMCELNRWPVIGEYPVRIGFHEVFHVIIAAGGVAFFSFIARDVLPHRHPVAVTACGLRFERMGDRRQSA